MLTTVARCVALFALVSAVTPAAGAELRIGHSSLPRSLGMPLADTSHSGGFSFQLVYDRLTYTRAGGQLEPGLATAWRNTSPTTWEVTLRGTVRFHDQKPLAAEDIVDLIAWLNTQEGGAKAAETVRETRNIVSARALGPLTVELTTREPDPLLPNLLGLMSGINMKRLQDSGFEGYAREPVGTGPFRTNRWASDQLDLAAFAEGWRRPKLDRVLVRALPELPARVQAFQSDQIDLAFQMVAENRRAVEAADGKLVSSAEPRVLLLMALQNRPGQPMNDVRVRRALNYAVNKDNYLRNVIGGLANAAGQPASATVNGHQSDCAPTPTSLIAPRRC